jgi:hypothetical protein
MWPFKAEPVSEREKALRERIVALEVDFAGLCRKFEDLEDAWATFRGRRVKTAALDASPAPDSMQEKILAMRKAAQRALPSGG